MELMTSSQKDRKKAVRGILFALLSIVTVVISITILCLFNSEKIGDWYLNVQKSPAKSIYWYEVSYNKTQNEEVLLKLGMSLKLSKNYTKQLDYYPLILSSKILDDNQRQNYMELYIESFYHTHNFSGFKTAYRKYAPNLTNNSSVVIPLQLIIDDESISDTDLRWALDFSNELLAVNDNLLIKSTLYDQQSAIYIRLGDNAQAAILDQKSKQIKAQLLK